jgi:hypothetical protein
MRLCIVPIKHKSVYKNSNESCEDQQATQIVLVSINEKIKHKEATKHEGTQYHGPALLDPKSY